MDDDPKTRTCCAAHCRRQVAQWPKPPTAPRPSKPNALPALILLDLMDARHGRLRGAGETARDMARGPGIIVTAKDLTREVGDAGKWPRGQSVAKGA